MRELDGPAGQSAAIPYGTGQAPDGFAGCYEKWRAGWISRCIKKQRE